MGKLEAYFIAALDFSTILMYTDEKSICAAWVAEWSLLWIF